MKNRSWIFYSILVGIWCTLLCLPFLEKREKDVNVQIQYVAGEGIEFVSIENIYLNRRITDVQIQNPLIEKEGNAYQWSGSEAVTIPLQIKGTDSLEFLISYEAKSETTDISDEAVLRIEIGNRIYTEKMGSFFNEEKLFCYQNIRWLHWIRCFMLFLSFGGLWYAFLSFFENRMKENKLKFCLSRLFTSRGFYVFTWALSARMYMNRWETIYHVNNDTPDYFMHSLGELSWFHRMPGYQLMFYFVEKIFRCSTDDILFRRVILVQGFLGVLTAVLLYYVLKKILKREGLAFIGALIFAAQPYLIYFERCLMTETLAIDMIVGLLWLLTCYLENPDKWKAFGIGIYALILTLTRPSFLILFPILAVFFVLKFWAEKETRKYDGYGIMGMLLSTVLLLLYCGNNYHITGQFMLCDVSYHNQLSILIGNGLYENDDYPEITEIIREYDKTEDDSLTVAIDVFREHGGYASGVKYLKDTLQKNRIEYLNCVINGWKERQHEKVWRDNSNLGEYFSEQYKDISTLLMPFSFLFVVLICLMELVRGVFVWCCSKKAPWIEFGLISLILATIILGYGTLTLAAPQRICICIIPLVLVLTLRVIEREVEMIIMKMGETI